MVLSCLPWYGLPPCARCSCPLLDRRPAAPKYIVTRRLGIACPLHFSPNRSTSAAPMGIQKTIPRAPRANIRLWRTWAIDMSWARPLPVRLSGENAGDFWWGRNDSHRFATVASGCSAGAPLGRLLMQGEDRKSFIDRKGNVDFMGLLFSSSPQKSLTERSVRDFS